MFCSEWKPSLETPYGYPFCFRAHCVTTLETTKPGEFDENIV